MAGGDAVQQIKDRLNIVDVVASYVELHKAGKNFKGKSPFTNEKTPSFYVSPDRGMYYCFSSSQGGDIFNFVQAMEGVDFKGALKMLAAKAGVELVAEDPQKRTERDRQYEVIEEATKFFERRFMNETEAQSYLEKRGVTAETRARWRVGYAPGPPQHGWRELKTHLEEKGYTKDELARAGLIKGFDTGKEPYDLFRDRVMFPIMDASGRVVAFSGRILTKDSEAPKYVNSPETELFVKSDILYGYDKAKEGIRKLNFSLIVEGQFDVVMTHQAGYNNTVAVSGTALTAHHVDLLQRLSNRVVLALDADRAGIAAVKRAADLMLSRSMDVKVAKFQDGQDPADMVLSDVQQFREVIKNSHHVIEYLLDVLEEGKRDERTWKLQVREEVLPYVAKIPNAIDREHFESLIAKRLNTTTEAIHTEVRKLLEKKGSRDDGAATVSPVESISVNTNHFEDYTEQLFAVLRYLERFEEQRSIFDNAEKQLRFILDEQFEDINTQMTTERLNRFIMLMEKTYESFPNKAFFENLAAKLNRYHQMRIDRELAMLRTSLNDASFNQDADTKQAEAIKRADELRQRKNVKIPELEI